MTLKSGNGMFSQMEELTAVPYTFRSSEKVRSASFIFWLNYGATAVILISASLAVTVKQFGGRPIECVVDKDLNVEVVNNFCWIHSTFSSWKLPEDVNDNDKSNSSQENNLKPEGDLGDSGEPIFMMENDGFKLLQKKERGEIFRYPTKASSPQMAKYSHGIWHSVGPYPGLETVESDSFIRYHKYVQWVAGILIFQKLVVEKFSAMRMNL